MYIRSKLFKHDIGLLVTYLVHIRKSMWRALVGNMNSQTL